MIATRNRVDELIITLRACRRQLDTSTEVLVVDDASTDGTYEAVREQFPEVNIYRNETNRGSIASRNDILRRARGRYIIALDDDSRLIDDHACRRIVDRMDAEPDIGILSLQVVGPEFPDRIPPSAWLRGEWHCSSFTGSGGVIRRSMLAKTGLFVESFFHAYEEPDLSLRAWDAGYRVVQWNDIMVFHEFSGANRNEQRTHSRHARNEACSTLMRYPWHLVLSAIFYRLYKQFLYALQRGWAWREARVWLEVLVRVPAAIRARRPVSTQAVKIWLGVNRERISDPAAVWKLGNQTWWHLWCSPLLDSSSAFQSLQLEGDFSKDTRSQPVAQLANAQPVRHGLASMPDSGPEATIVITTKNRKDDLRAAIQSALHQLGRIELLVIDDGSTDGTPAMLQAEFSSVRVIRAEQSQGYIVQRNRGARLASAPFIFSIDDDAVFSTPQTVLQTLRDFDHPRVGAVAIPFVNTKQDDLVRQSAEGRNDPLITNAYIGTAHAVRRDLFLGCGGYREALFHQGEEQDFCLRLLAAGFVTRVGRADPIHHFESPRRDFHRMDVYGRRNDILFAWHNVPLPYLPFHLLGTTWNGMRHGIQVGRAGAMLHGLLHGYASLLLQWTARHSVSSGVYRLSRRLKQRGPIPFAAIEELLPEMDAKFISSNPTDPEHRMTCDAKHGLMGTE